MPKPLLLEAEQLPILTHPTVAYYLFGMSALIFAIVVVGGLTRLTESGLSITEWNLVTGVLPPLSREGWEAELAKYAQTPEGKLCVAASGLDLNCSF
jgi:cytochrome c oxidase assembly protein subunit 15